MESCSEGLVDNKLSLRLGKTECVLFGPKRKLKKKKKKKKKITNITCKGEIFKFQGGLNILIFS